MKYLACLLLLSVLLPCAHGQAVPGSTGGRNPVADPFALAPKVEAPVRVVQKAPVAGPPLASASVPRVSLPPGLHAILIRENGMGLLSSGEPGAPSIAVTNGREVRIQEQDFRVEITQSSIRLFSAWVGRVVWEGSLAGNAAQVLPADMSQFKYIPPLSAGVDPGLGGSSDPGRMSGSPMIKVTESH